MSPRLIPADNLFFIQNLFKIQNHDHNVFSCHPFHTHIEANHCRYEKGPSIACCSLYLSVSNEEKKTFTDGPFGLSRNTWLHQRQSLGAALRQQKQRPNHNNTHPPNTTMRPRRPACATNGWTRALPRTLPSSFYCRR